MSAFSQHGGSGPVGRRQRAEGRGQRAEKIRERFVLEWLGVALCPFTVFHLSFRLDKYSFGYYHTSSGR